MDIESNKTVSLSRLTTTFYKRVEEKQNALFYVLKNLQNYLLVADFNITEEKITIIGSVYFYGSKVELFTYDRLRDEMVLSDYISQLEALPAESNFDINQLVKDKLSVSKIKFEELLNDIKNKLVDLIDYIDEENKKLEHYASIFGDSFNYTLGDDLSLNMTVRLKKGTEIIPECLESSFFTNEEEYATVKGHKDFGFFLRKGQSDNITSFLGHDFPKRLSSLTMKIK